MSRERVTQASAILVLIALVLFGLAYAYTAYQFLLFGVFLLCLGASHAALADGKLSASAIRKMDFAYVSCACAAAFIGFLSSQSISDRDPYLRLLTELNLNRREYFLPTSANASALSQFARQGSREFCAGDFLANRLYEPKFCKWADHIADVLEAKPTGPDAERLYDNSRAEAHPYWDSTAICLPPQRPAEPNGVATPSIFSDPDKWLLCSRAVFADGLLNGLDVMVKRATLHAVTPPRAVPDATTIGGLTKALIWPLILAVALALRLTKASADVSGWAT